MLTEKLALQRKRTVSHLVEEVITDLMDVFFILKKKPEANIFSIAISLCIIPASTLASITVPVKLAHGPTGDNEEPGYQHRHAIGLWPRIVVIASGR